MKNLSFDSFNVQSVAVVLTVPGLAIGAFGSLSLGPTAVTLLAALAVLGASTILALSLYRVDGMPRLAALLLVAFVAILPEFTADTYHAWMGVGPLSPDYGDVTLSAITGTSLFLLGVGLPSLYMVHRLRTGNTRFELHSSQGIELLLLLMVVFYGFVIYIKGYLWPLDTPILLMLFGLLVWKGFQRYRSTHVRLRPFQRSVETTQASEPPSTGKLLLVLYATIAVYVAIPAFADGMHALGMYYDAAGFVVMQDLIPILTKVPLLAVLAVMVWNGKVGLAMSVLLLVIVSLWTLVLGVLPFAPFVGGVMYGSPDVLTLGGYQRMEVLVAFSQALLAVTLLSRLALTGKGAITLLLVFFIQRALMYVYPQVGSSLAQGIMVGLYTGLAAAIVAWDRSRVLVLVSTVVEAPFRSATDLVQDGVPEIGASPPPVYVPPNPASD